MIAARDDQDQQSQPLSDPALLLDSVGSGIYALDAGGRCTFINATAASALGYRADEAVGKDMHELVHHSREDGSAYPVPDCPILQSLHSGRSSKVDGEVFWRKDGRCFPVTYTCRPMTRGGAVKGAVVTFNDAVE
ncbi:MAG: PAS domain-containing protein, partial [Chloroflexota bacterium]|nr:PAS domain-containing protein [Chloroflexota bacterium]